MNGRLIPPGLPALLVLLFSLLSSPADAQDFGIPVVMISGGELAGSVRLAPADADAFRRRVAQPPRLDDEPAVSGPVYVVTSGYWPGAVRLEDEEEARDVEAQADYYPVGGFVRVSLAGEDVWMVLDLRQRAVLDRYIRLSLEGKVGETPSTLEVLAEAAATETLGGQAGADPVDAAVIADVASALAAANPRPFVDPRQPPAGDGDGFWLNIAVPEGRSLRYFFDGETLTEALGTERYDASSIAETLRGLAPSDTPTIEHEEPVGSLLWWPVMVGGGLAALGAAFWFRRRAFT